MVSMLVGVIEGEVAVTIEAVEARGGMFRRNRCLFQERLTVPEPASTRVVRDFS